MTPTNTTNSGIRAFSEVIPDQKSSFSFLRNGMTNSYIKSLSGLDYDSTSTKLPESPALTSLILRYCLVNLLYPVYIGDAGLMRLD